MANIRSLLNYFKGKKYMGCDLGASCLKVVKLEKVEGGLSLLKMNILKVPDTLGGEDRSRRIQSFLQQNDFLSDGNVAVNIEDPTLLIRSMELPKMPERDMATAIRWNFREFVSGSVDDYMVSYLPVKGLGEAEKLTLTTFCISRQAVADRQTLMKSAGLKVSFIEPNATALLAAFSHNIGWERDKYYVILDMGDSISNFIVVGNGCLMFSRPLANLHGRKLVDLVSKDLATEKDKADEELKGYLTDHDKREAKSSDLGVNKIGDTVSHFISQLIVDMQRSIDAFCIMYKKDRVDKIYLCGGGICLPGIVERLSSGLGVELEFFNPFSNILNAETARKMSAAPMYAVALGLALPRE